MKTSRIILAATLLAVPTLRAQIVADGATNILSNVTNNGPSTVTVGTNGAFTLLVLSDNALLNNNLIGVIGRNALARSNEVRLISATARWNFAGFGELYVGSNGASSRLTVSGGGSVSDYSGTIGQRASSTNNSVLVTDPGSRWSGFSLSMGNEGAFNQLTVSNGATISSSLAFVGSATTASDNLVTVTGSEYLDERWSLFFGSGSAGNRMTVSGGGWLVCRDGYVGLAATANRNMVLVTDTGSAWTNLVSLSVGDSGSGNQLIASNGATVSVGGNAMVGFNNGANSNSVSVTDPGTLWLVGGSLFVGSNGAMNRLIVSNGGKVFGQAIGISGAIGQGATGSNNLAVVTGAGSFWSNAYSLYVGVNGAANQLVVSSGGLAHAEVSSFVGSNTTSSNNVATVTDSGSLWNTDGALYFGFNGAGNRLVVTNGGVVRDGSGYIGVNSSSSNNVAVVTGSGSLWSNTFELRVGYVGSGNQLVVSNGATVFTAANGFIGHSSGANLNTAILTDPGSRWLINSNLYVGSNGALNLLLVSNAGLVESYNGQLGFGASSSNNVAVVTGTGSLWRIQQGLFVGYSGSGSRLVITNGGRVCSTEANIGYLTASNNEVLVTGTGSVWTNVSNLQVGSLGSGNRLVISDGGEVVEQAFNVILGAGSSSLNNRIVVDGGTLRATNATGTSALDVRRGTSVFNAGLIDVNRLLLTNTLGKFEFNGGMLITRGAFISNGVPFFVGTSGTTPAIWDVRAGVTNTFVGGDLWIGSNAPFNQLILTNGALLTNSGGAYIGGYHGAGSNSVTLAGAGSQWLLDDGVTVGYLGSGNRLVVSNGATLVTGSSSYIGRLSISSNNEVVVTGAGSSWTSDPGQIGLMYVYVGYSGHDSRLVVSDGGLVASYEGLIGYGSEASNNLAVVTGAGSTWNNALLHVGNIGVGNRLVVSNSAVAFASDVVTVGAGPASTKNRLTVDGGTLRTTNASATAVLDVRRGTNVLNTGLVDVDVLRLTNTLGFFEFNGGTLSVKSSTVSNGQSFRVGNGVSPATLVLAGNGSHSFASGLTVSTNAAITGNGNLTGAFFTVQAGGLISPGTSIGKIGSTSSPSLQGATFMEISRNGATVTNDQLAVMGSLTYGGTLTVTNIGPNALASGNHFKLFDAAPYAGSFTAISLPPLAPGLSWTNKLSVDGSIDVIGTPLPKFASITVSGTNVIIAGTNGLADAPYTVVTSTNVALPLSNWVSIATNQFGPNGEFSFTNGIAPGELQRYFRIRTP